VFGGMDDKDEHSNDLFILNLPQKTWERVDTYGPIPRGRSKHSGIIMNNKLYITGKFFSLFIEFFFERGVFSISSPI